MTGHRCTRRVLLAILTVTVWLGLDSAPAVGQQVEPPPPSKDTIISAEPPIEIAGIVVTARRAQRPTAAHYELSPVGIARVPPLAEPDIFRAVSTLPGIDQPNGWRSAFHIRGGASDESLILVDGMPLTEPFHMLGLFGGVQLGVVGRAAAHLGAPPAHFDDRLSGIIEIETLLPDSAFERAHVSVLSGGGVVGRRWDLGGRRGTMLVGARYATTELISAFIDAGSYGFTDANLRVRQEFGGRWALDASAYLNGDWINDDGTQRNATFRSDHGWGNRAGRLGLLYGGTSGVRGRVDLLYSGYGIDFDDVHGESGERVEAIDAGTGLFRLGVRFDLPVGLSHTLTAGAAVERERFEHRWRGAFEEFSPNLPPTYQYESTQRRVSAHVADRWAPADVLELSVGIRALHLPEAVEAGPHLAPRVAARVDAAPGLELFGSAGRLLQTTAQAEEARELNVGVPHFALTEQPNVADAAELGAELSIGATSRLRITGFAKEYRRVAQLDSAALALYPSVPFPSFEFGSGRSRGIETMFTLAGDRLDAQLAYTYTHTRLRFGGPELPPNWDAPHSAKGLASLALGRGWRATVAGTLRSGLPYTPVLGTVLLPDGPESRRRVRREYIRGETNSRRLSDSKRLDVGIEKQGSFRSANYTVRLQVLNVLNQRTILRLNPAPYYDYGMQGYILDDAFDRSIPLLPTLGVEMHF